MKVLEKYSTKSQGFHPLLLRQDWQVAKLNFTKEQAIEHIKKVEAHHHTDEAFILLQGSAVLITYHPEEPTASFDVCFMERHLIYNIPRNTWHNIAMQKGSEILIVEKRNTHLNDVVYKELDDHLTKRIQKEVQNAFTKENQ